MQIADERKESHKLGQKWKSGVPLEVLPLAYRLYVRKRNEIKRLQKDIKQYQIN